MGSPVFKPNQGEQSGSHHLLCAKHLADTFPFSVPCKACKSVPSLEMSQWELREAKSVVQDHTNKRVSASQRVFPLVRDSPGHTAWQPDLRTCLPASGLGNTLALQWDLAAGSSDFLRLPVWSTCWLWLRLYCRESSASWDSNCWSRLGRPVTLHLAVGCRGLLLGS